MNDEHLVHLVEANEKLVLAILQAHVQREADTRKLQELSQAVQVDALTRLPSRLLLLDRFGHAIANAKRRGDRVALLFLDLNKFEQISDTLGQAAGDEVLKTVARCLKGSVRESDTVSRHSGDKFLILLEEISNVSDIRDVVEKILASLGVPNRVGANVIRLTASVGISLYPDNGDGAEMLITLAESALHTAKRMGNNRFAFAGQEISEQLSSVELLPPLLQYEISLADNEQRRAHRRSDDERMIYATLNAQALQAGAELALRRQTEFIAMLAHELRNPLGPIRNATTLIRQGRSDPDAVTEMHCLIDRQVEHLTKLLDDVFDMSRISTGKMRIEQERVDLLEIIRQAVEVVQFSIDLRRQKLRCILPDFPVYILGDPTRLNQIFGNLLDNASKYSPEEKEIALTVEKNETSVIVKVTDTGIGITEEALSNLFKLFVQDPDATRFNGKGLGIGLALVKDLVEAHGGTVTARSDGSGLGSQFTVILSRELELPDPM